MLEGGCHTADRVRELRNVLGDKTRLDTFRQGEGVADQDGVAVDQPVEAGLDVFQGELDPAEPLRGDAGVQRPIVGDISLRLHHGVENHSEEAVDDGDAREGGAAGGGDHLAIHGKGLGKERVGAEPVCDRGVTAQVSLGEREAASPDPVVRGCMAGIGAKVLRSGDAGEGGRPVLVERVVQLLLSFAQLPRGGNVGLYDRHQAVLGDAWVDLVEDLARGLAQVSEFARLRKVVLPVLDQRLVSHHELRDVALLATLGRVYGHEQQALPMCH
ncbi:uncharacterized protein BcabD6B2_04380 [Babesia caballi]|uniref:Uncharacterized protein n=1 Tax=Babesia caballi TaxID=5871 RepID=A0AAV4LLL0_BABCB|nr:hypothetical protein BcabD6B2_04380 [Babesia caballi]